MEQIYDREVIYINRNVVNTVYNGFFDIEKNIEARYSSNRILFVGNLHYVGAAIELIKAYKIIKEQKKDSELHIIGMTKRQLNVIDENIYCYGYLRKDIKEERDLYYLLMHNCKVFVNPAQQWGGYSSTIEAMYYGCPVIVAPYDDFACEFGKEIDFGRYTDGQELHNTIESIINASKDEYTALCMNAYNRVSGYTWSNYVEEFLDSLKKEGIINE